MFFDYIHIYGLYRNSLISHGITCSHNSISQSGIYFLDRFSTRLNIMNMTVTVWWWWLLMYINPCMVTLCKLCWLLLCWCAKWIKDNTQGLFHKIGLAGAHHGWARNADTGFIADTIKLLGNLSTVQWSVLFNRERLPEINYVTERKQK